MKAKIIQRAGRVLGKKLKDQIKSSVKEYEIGRLMRHFPDWVETGISLSAASTPKACAMLLGIAEGSGISFQEAFCLWYEELIFADTERKDKLKDTGCTDIVVKGESSVIIGHTNDEGKGDGSELFKICIKGLPDIFAVFTRGTPSIGLNSKGIVISGNQIDANDTRPGVPRMLLYVEALWSKTIKEAEKILLCPDRASSFNNIIADDKGNVVSIEASAKKAVKLIHPTGVAAHTNHFIFLPKAEAREGSSLKGSRDRLERAIKEIKDSDGDLSVRSIIGMLSTHNEGGLCRHGDNDSHTVFSIVFIPNKRSFIYSSGNPCQGKFKQYKY